MKRALILCLAVLMILTFTGCQKETKVVESTSETAVNPLLQSSSNDEYIFVLALQNIEYFNAHKYMWEKIGEDFGVKTTIVGPADMDVNATAAAMEQAIAKRPKGIITWGFDAGLDSAVNNAMEAGIPVVPIIGDLPTSSRNTYVGSSQFELGYIGGMALGEELGGKGKVAILTLPGIEQFDSRETGFRDAINAMYPNIDIVTVGDTKADLAIALQAGKDILNAIPDLDGFFGTDSTAAFGAVTAVKEMGKEGEVKIVGMDRNSDILQEVKNGSIAGTIAQNDCAAVFWAFMTIYSEHYYQPQLTSDNIAAKSFAGPAIIYTKPNYVNADNVDFYLKANEIYTN